MQETEVIDNSEVILRRTSETKKIRMRENFSLDLVKTIYEKTPYPSNKGGFEKAFAKFADSCTSVRSFLKLLPNTHPFVRFRYIKEDGLTAFYYPDFLVRTPNEQVFVVETKAEDQLTHPNVKRKHLSAVDWTEKVNKLPPEKRDNAEWSYVLLGQAFFDDWKKKGASMQELLEYAKLRSLSVNGGLF